MKKLNLEQMTIIQGGTYCDNLLAYMTGKYVFQGDLQWLYLVYFTYCI
jgi:hypothetical protein